jgi:hypothetical protein
MSESVRESVRAGDPDPSRRRETVIEARLALLAAAYPSLVNDESRSMIRDEIGTDIDRDARIRRFVLGNGDEPMAPFRPYRSDGAENGA